PQISHLRETLRWADTDLADTVQIDPRNLRDLREKRFTIWPGTWNLKLEIVMLLNHIKIAIRNLLRDHLYSVINVGGLAVGIAASVLLMLWVQEELSFDRFHQKADRIYRVNA